VNVYENFVLVIGKGKGCHVTYQAGTERT